VTVFNASSSKWLQKLREAMRKVNSNKKVYALESGVVTRWTSTWLACCSLLRARNAFDLLLLENPVKVQQITSSASKSTSNLRRCIKTIRDCSFWNDLVEYMEILVPTIESSLVLQGGDATFADVLYCRGRQYQTLEYRGEFEALEALEQRWGRLEQPQLLVALYFHPKYRSIGIMLPISEYVLKKYVNGYVSRWGSAAACGVEDNVSTSAAIADWALGVAHWVREAAEFHGNPCNFWASGKIPPTRGGAGSERRQSTRRGVQETVFVLTQFSGPREVIL
jgi:hypothetical protein